MTIMEFLEARLIDDEEAARAAADHHSTIWRPYSAKDGFRDVKDDDGDVIVQANDESPTAEQATHIARHDPARVLREVEAKRAIVVEHTCDCPDPDCGECGACSGAHHADPTAAPCDTLRVLAAVYSDHEDFQEEWRP